MILYKIKEVFKNNNNTFSIILFFYIGLFLGNMTAALNKEYLQENNIRAVLTVADCFLKYED